MNEPENEAATATYELTPQMAPEAEATARARLAEMSDEQKHRLICLPVLGWENERLLLQNEAPHSWRILGEVLATSRVAEMERIRSALQNLRDEWNVSTLFQHGGEAAAAFEDRERFGSALSELVAEVERGQEAVSGLRDELQDVTTRGLPELWPLERISKLLGITKSTISTYLSQMRAEDAHLPEAKRRIQTPKGGQLTQIEYEHLCAFVKTKVPRPKARRNPPKKRRV